MSRLAWKHQPDRHSKHASRNAQQWQANRQQDDGDAEQNRDEPENGRNDPEEGASDTAQNSHCYFLFPAESTERTQVNVEILAVSLYRLFKCSKLPIGLGLHALTGPHPAERSLVG